MIVPMKKLSMVIHQDYVATTLARLQDIGVVHIEARPETREKLSDKIALHRRIREFVAAAEAESAKERPDTPATAAGTHQDDDVRTDYDGGITALIETYERYLSQRESRYHELAKYAKTRQAILPWGHVRAETVSALSGKGVRILYYKVFARQFQKLDLSAHVHEVIARDATYVYFIVLQGDDRNRLPVEPAPAPEMSLDACAQKMDDLRRRIETIDRDIHQLFAYERYARAQAKFLADQIAYLEAHETCADFAGRFSTLSGWVPVNALSALTSYLKKQDHIIYLLEDPPPSAAVSEIPVALKNGVFARFFEPITRLFSLPSYAEMDLTPFFAPFFALFYGVCMGDSGYGLVMVLVSLIAAIFFKKYFRFAVLGMIFGLAVMAWGLLSGTFFGVDVALIKVPLISRAAVFTSEHLFYMALLIGLFQILFGMALKFLNCLIRRRWQDTVLPVGWLMLVVSLVIMYMYSKSAPPDFVIGQLFMAGVHAMPLRWAYVGTGIGVALILFFNNPRLPVYARVGTGLWELYGITGVLGDLLSYIRLFALGLSSAILGSVVNTMAFKILDMPIPVVSWLLFALFLVFGHAGNFAIAGLGAFVHPLRLTFVEFYKNAGFMGGGVPYRPFQKSAG